MEKIAVVTGGSRGIGLATVQTFAEKGWKVYALSRHKAHIDGVIHLTCDITDENSVKDTVNQIVEESGRIDCMICNAGFGISGAIEFTDVEDAKRLFDVNFFGGLRCAQAVVPHMRKQGEGHIIFTSSVAAVMPIPFQGFYSATKGAVNMMAGTLGNEVKQFGIQVACVMPGDVRTGFTAAREKSLAGSQVYGESIEKSVAVMEHDEQNGMHPEDIAKAIYKAANKSHMKPLYTPGFMYKFFILLKKLLPARLVYWIIGKLYIK